MAAPERPEPKFFLDEGLVRGGKAKYFEKLFGGDSPKDIWFGEKSTSYYENAGACRNIQSMFPLAPVILMLRNPIERALSNYYFSVQNGLETRSLSGVFLEGAPAPELNFKVSVSPFDYINRSRYSIHLLKCKEIFGDNLFTFISEELFRSVDCISPLANFMNIGMDFPFHSKGERVNESVVSNSTDPNVLRDVKAVLFDQLSDEIGFMQEILKRKIELWQA